MRIIIAHTYYQQPGGEDQVYEAEADLLESEGHDVVRYKLHNNEVREMGRWSLAKATVWNGRVRTELGELVRRHRADVVHFHNTFPLISPAAYGAARAAGAAVVQTLHNFRLLCVNPVLLRDGRICEECVGKAVAWQGVYHGCYRGSRSASAVLAMTTAVHWALGTWKGKVDRYIAPSGFARAKLIEGGLPAEQIATKRHLVNPDPGVGDGSGGYAVFVGRLAREKGLATLLKAWAKLKTGIGLKIVGDGPMVALVRNAAQGGQIEWLGRKPAAEVMRIIGKASFLVAPSECYETFGRVVAEAFAKGTPVIASRLGALAELVEHGRTGLLFGPGDADDLAGQVEAMLGDAERLAKMRREARAEFEAKYTGSRNYEQMMRVYEEAVAVRKQRGPMDREVVVER
ncbi:MAG: glycosyltransferase family 4 protein [Planctomycetota bacterium]|nr:glycosyltransferase family 4 protein [Planctomycetota bacterium]